MNAQKVLAWWKVNDRDVVANVGKPAAAERYGKSPDMRPVVHVSDACAYKVKRH